MARISTQIKKYWLINLVTFLVSLAVGAGIFCAMFFTRNRTLIAALDGTTIGSAVLILIGLLMWVNYMGMFDLAVFGTKQLFTMMFSKNPRKQGYYHDYRDQKHQERLDSSMNFIFVILAGIVMAIVVLILFILYNSRK